MKSNKRLEKLKGHLDDVAKYFSLGNICKFDYKSILFIGFIISVFILSILFKIHTSSTNVWFDFVDIPGESKAFDLGREKAIRSDEWFVRSSFIFSQIENDFPEKNQNIGAKKAPLVADVPVKNPITVFRPQQWGYFIFDAERGFIFDWNFRLFGMIVGLFVFFMITTRGKFYLAVVLSFSFFFSSFNQWWFSSISGILMTFFLMFDAMVFFLLGRKKTIIITAALLFILFSINFILFLYPPFQIPLLYIIVFGGLGLILRYPKRTLHRKSFPCKAVMAVLILIIGAVVLSSYLDFINETLTAMRSTAYPGVRFVDGGGLFLARLFYGYYSFFINVQHFPAILGNVSESSNFIMLFPLIIPVLLISLLGLTPRIRIDAVDVFLIILWLIFIFWSIFGFGQLFSKFSFLYLVPETRLLLGIAVCDWMLFSRFISRIFDHKKFSKPQITGGGRYLYPLLIFVFILVIGLLTKNSSLDYFNNLILILIPLLFGFVSWLIYSNKKNLLLISLVLISIPNIFVNPVTFGINAYDSSFLHNISESLDDETVIVYGDMYEANLLKGYGIEVLNGTNLVPKSEVIEKFDIEDDYSETYNRYSHISFEISETSQDPIIELTSNDSYSITVNPCQDLLQNFGNEYFFVKDCSREFACAKKVDQLTHGDICLYRYK